MNLFVGVCVVVDDVLFLAGGPRGIAGFDENSTCFQSKLDDS